jgi:hypothetical protein
MASAFLIERAGTNGPRSIILSKRYPCARIESSEQTLVNVGTGPTFAAARRAVISDLKKEDPARAERLVGAVNDADAKARAAGLDVPAPIVEVGLFGLPKPDEAAEEGD